MLRSVIILSAMAIGVSIASAPCVAAQAPVVRHPTALRGIDDVKPGTKLRVVMVTNPSERIDGRFGSVTSAALTLRVGGGQRRELSISQLLRVDEAYPDRMRGALVGLLPGVVGVYAWDFFSGPHPRYSNQSRRYQENAIALVASCTLGALIGAARGWERWQPLQTSAR